MEKLPTPKDALDLVREFCGDKAGIEVFTCFNCPAAMTGCEFVWDPYNTDGDCLAEK